MLEELREKHELVQKELMKSVERKCKEIDKKHKDKAAALKTDALIKSLREESPQCGNKTRASTANQVRFEKEFEKDCGDEEKRTQFESIRECARQ